MRKCPACAVPGPLAVGRHDEAGRVHLRQSEGQWNSDGFVVMAGSLAALGQKDEAAALARRGIERFPGLLSIERFALNRGWPPYASKVMVDLMRRAGFPACATSEVAQARICSQPPEGSHATRHGQTNGAMLASFKLFERE